MPKFKIPFNKKLYIEQVRLTLPYVYASEFEKVKASSILALSFIIIGLIILFVGSELSTLFFTIAIFVVFDLHGKNDHYNRVKSAHMRALKVDLHEFKTTSCEIFDFREDCLRYATEFLCIQIIWEDFQKYKVTKSSLLLIQREIQEEVFVINKSELKTIEFQNILSLVQKKIN